MLRQVLLLLASSAALGGCAAAPRAPAATLATAGIAATGSFGAEVQDVAAQLRAADVNDAFTRTLELCTNAPVACAPSTVPLEISQRRDALADVVELRARAIGQLGQAYVALQTEAADDAGADLQGAGQAAVDSANSFAAAAAQLRGRTAQAAVPGQVASLVDFGFGALGEHLQRRRILAVNREIAKAVLQLRNGLQQEQAVFDSLSEYLIGKRAAARLALYQTGLSSTSAVMSQIATGLGMTLVPNSDSIVAGSVPIKTALLASIQALSRQDVLAAQGRYRISIAALDSLLRQHAELEARQSVSIADVQRLIDRLNASLDKSSATQGN